jgi:nitrate reductase NapD
MNPTPHVASAPDDLDELHIASLVLHVLPQWVARVRRSIAKVEGAEIHGVGPTGKMVVTLEALGAAQLAARIAELQSIDGVMSAALVYQHAEPIDQMNEEVPHDTDQTDLHQAVGGRRRSGRGGPANPRGRTEHHH